MNKKIILGVVSGWVVAALLLASCAPAVVEEEKKAAPPKAKVEVPKVVPEEKEVVAPKKETTGPRYGGTLKVAYPSVIRGFDEHVLGSHLAAITGMLTNESLVTGDWTKGEAGSGEVEYAVGNTPFYWGYEMGALIESWEWLDADTISMKVRKGVQWGLNQDSEASRLVGGREVTADDIAYNINRFFTLKTAWGARVYKRWWLATDDHAIGSVKVDGDTVILNGNNAVGGSLGTWEVISDWHHMYPPEVIEKYGHINDWENSVGTGAFMLTDFVPASAATFIRNPNYWMTDPIGPGKGNQLPYLDGVRMLIIPDTSTRMAALRAGKLDALGFSPLIAAEDFEPLIAANPELQSKGLSSRGPGTVYFKLDSELFDDIRVRKALHMAVNFKEIRDEYYNGQAVYPTFSLAPYKGVKDAYTPLEEMPAELRELWEYNPEKAKQLLDDAGYPGPDRFTTQILLWQPEHIDLASVLAAYWAKIGVTLELNVETSQTFTTLARARKFTGMVIAAHARFAAPYKWVELKYPSSSNYAGWYDDNWMAMHTKLWAFEALGKHDMRNALAKEMNLYALKDVVGIGLPFPDAYRVWWPWLKNYHGEYGLGYMDRFNFATYIWIDADLKESMGH